MASHHSQFRVYYEDTDAGGIVYHARYLGFAERARAEALRTLGMPIGELAERDGIVFVVRQLSIQYHAPLRLDELCSVETVFLEGRAARLKLRQNITNVSCDNVKVVTLDVELACLKAETMVPIRIPAQYRLKLRSLEGKSLT